jgi:hypothetical protein
MGSGLLLDAAPPFWEITPMAQNNDSLEAVKAAAESLLDRAASPELAASFLFPYGINKVAISVKFGDAEVRIELSGPETSDEEDGEFDEDDDELWLDEDFEDDEEETHTGNGR